MKKIVHIFSLVWLVIILSAILVQKMRGDLIPLDVDQILVGPSFQHFFGTDSLGRDLFSRLINGTANSLLIGLFSTSLSIVLGLCYGMAAGWFDARVDRVLMKLTEILLAVPSFAMVTILTLAAQSCLSQTDAITKSFIALIFGIGLSHWMNIARTIRGMTLKIKNEPYIEAAIALGSTNVHILRRHVLPNISNQVMVLSGLQLASNILYEGFVSFLGIGIQSPQTSLGLLAQEGWKSLSSYPHLMLFPALILFLTIWSIHVLIDTYFKH